MVDYPIRCPIEAQRRKEGKTRIIVYEISLKRDFFTAIHLRSESSMYLDTATSANNFAVDALCKGCKQESFTSTTWERDFYSF